MPLIKINGITYEFEQLTEEVKGHLRYLSFIDAELEQNQMRIASMRIARDEVGRRLDQALVEQSLIQSAEGTNNPQSISQANQPHSADQG